jgi:hypothetical protein
MSRTAKLQYEMDEDKLSVAAFATAEARKNPPLLAWAEPEASFARRGQPGRIRDFQPLFAGRPAWPEDLPLVEARLFWANSALHVVAEGNGCRWVKLRESDAGEEGKEEVQRSEKPVLTLQDAARFGLDTRGWPGDSLTAIEYRSGGRLVGWRLTTSGKEQAS